METNRIELGAEYYDKVFQESHYFQCHYSKSHYFPLMQAVLKHLQPDDNILELGCGTGQMAHLLWDEGYKNYTGVDISQEGIRQAKERSPQKFRLTSLYGRFYGFNVVLIMEVLEHINDIRLLEILEPGIKVVGTLPDFEDEISHLRYFKTEKDIRNRYDSLLKFNHIEKIGRWWLFEAIR